jgi:hypothetical protein
MSFHSNVNNNKHDARGAHGTQTGELKIDPPKPLDRIFLSVFAPTTRRKLCLLSNMMRFLIEAEEKGFLLPM